MASELNDAVSRGHLRQQVTTRILSGVFQRRFPSGCRLVTQKLAEMFEVSPTPVRESLVELESLGIVDLLPNRGAVVRPFGPREVREISQIRRILEVEATRLACGRGDDASLAEMEHELERLRKSKLNAKRAQSGRQIDSRLHNLISSACGSRRLASEIQRYLTLFRALRDVSHQYDGWMIAADMPDQHLAIVRPLRDGATDAAASAMDSHLCSVAELLAGVMFDPSVTARATAV